MRWLFISQYYPPETAAGGVRISEFASTLAARGHQVQVLTALPNYPLGKLYAGYRHRPFTREWVGDVEVCRVPVWLTRRGHRSAQLAYYLSFAAAATAAATRLGWLADGIVASSPPLFVGIAGWWASRLYRCPFVLDVRDLWPESAMGVGALRDGPALRFGRALARHLYRSADTVVATSRGIAERVVAEGRPELPVRVIYNGVNAREFAATADPRERFEWERDDGVVALYAGNFGLAQGLETLVEAARLLRHEPRVSVVLMGDGVTRGQLEAQARKAGLTNIAFLPSIPRVRMAAALHAADILLVHLKPDPVFRTAIPSKIFEYLASGRPIVFGLDGEPAELLKASGAALGTGGGDASGIAAAILRLVEDHFLRSSLGRRGVAFVERSFDRRVQALELEELLTSLASRRGRSPVATDTPAHRPRATEQGVLGGESGVVDDH